MTESEIQEYIELTSKAENNELTDEEFKRYVELTTDFILKVSERVDEVQQNWEEAEQINAVLCDFIAYQDIVGEFKEFLNERPDRDTEEQILN